MSDPTTPPSRKTTVERRSGRDRRQRDAGLPAGRERRRHVEMRRPDVAEIEMTPSEWDRLHADTEPTPLDERAARAPDQVDTVPGALPPRRDDDDFMP